MRVARTLFMMCLIALSQCAQAVHKCVGVNGKIAYSDQPCAGATGGSANLMAVGASVRVTTYDVEAPDIPSLLRELAARKTHHGHATWNLEYRFRTQPTGGRCGITAMTTKLDLAMTLPRWRPPANASAEALARWERYIAALRAHENGHLDHGRGAERELRAAAQGVVAPDCATAEPLVHAHFRRILADYQARDLDYDRRTQHGRTQGAWLN